MLPACRKMTVQIKIESATDLWRIDKICADFSPDLPVSKTILKPVEAIDGHGYDVLPVLRTKDGDYYVSLPGDSANVAFPELPSVFGAHRFYVLETGGYYHIWYKQGASNQSQYVEKMFDDPSLALHAVLPLWRRDQSAGNPGKQ